MTDNMLIWDRQRRPALLSLFGSGNAVVAQSSPTLDVMSTTMPAKKPSSGRCCAYCGLPRRLTREHIWPASIIRRLSDRPSYNPKAGRLLWTEMVIADVCEPCNGGLLDRESGNASLVSSGMNVIDVHKDWALALRNAKPLQRR